MRTKSRCLLWGGGISTVITQFVNIRLEDVFGRPRGDDLSQRLKPGH
jgi:hypothetical protein